MKLPSKLSTYAISRTDEAALETRILRDMKLLAPVRLVATAALFAFALPAAMTAREQTPGTERDARAFLRTFQEASSRKDRAELERLIAPEFTAVDRAGTTRDRAAWIEAVVSGAMLAQKSDAEELSDELAVFGSTAAVRTTVLRFQDLARNRDIAVKTRTVCARLDREWQVLSTQQTQLHDGAIVTTNFDGVLGNYQLESGRTFTIARRGRTLVATLPTGSTNVPLFETPDPRWLLGPGGEFAYTFERDTNGRATAVTMSRYGQTVWRATRDPVAATTALPQVTTETGEAKSVYRPSDTGVTLPIVVREVKPRYTREAMENQIQGAVWMRVVVLESGDVGDVKVTTSLDDRYGLDQEAVSAAKQWKFRPGTKDGKPVAVEVTVQLSFALKK